MGPSLHVVATNIEGGGATIPSDGVIQIAFDRYLLPSTITRQSFIVLDSSRKPLTDPAIRTIYDPVARTVTIAGPARPGAANMGTEWLTPDQTYRVLLPVPADKDSDFGVRAIDRATLEEPREYVFRATQPTRKVEILPAVEFCADVFPLFQNRCSGPTCHGSTEDPTSTPAASLLLGTSQGVMVTARSRVAQGANTSGRAYSPEPSGNLFGVNMAIIEPGNPGASWLVYKVELAGRPTVDAPIPPHYACTPPGRLPPVPARSLTYPPLVPGQAYANDRERAILSDYVLGREMPYPSTSNPAASASLTFDERERIRIWIALGAEVHDCGGCGVLDAGATSALPDAATIADASDDGDAADASVTGDSGDAGISDAPSE